MAVDDSLGRETDTFVLPTKSYYPTKIPIAHYQLRHFISCPEPDLLYYASGFDVYCLNVVTHTQAHVTTLPWEARCTAAGHGYVCVGGADSGNFAAIKVTGFPPTDPSAIDASLPLDFEARLPRPPSLSAAPSSRVRLEKIGEDIVNSISIHKLPAQGGRPEEVVAVLTNNDKTVRLYSLAYNLELMVLDLPIAMNHATISPDGQMLVAVGDAPVAFFFQQSKVEKASGSKTAETVTIPPEWELLERVALFRPANSHADGYFTTAWSPSGRLCAVGSECGYITVFDVDLLKLVEYGEDAVVELICSTRPDIVAGAGAVRTMHFSPAPWDFLVWSEDQGRVCVADLRTELKVKQVLTLDPKESGLQTTEIADFDLTVNPELQDLRREADFIRGYRRALDAEGTAAAVDHASNYFEADTERNRLHSRLGVVESDNDPYGLTARERQVLEALRTTRPREEGREPGITPRSINYNSSGTRESLPEPSRRDVANAISNYTSENPRRWFRNSPLPTTAAHQVISIVEGTVNVPAEVITHITDSALTRSPNPVPAHAQRAPAEIVNATDDAWRTITEALGAQERIANRTAAAAASNPTATTSTTNLTAPELRSELRRVRQLSQMRERLRNARAEQSARAEQTARAEQSASDTYAFSLGLRRPSRSTHDPALGVRTAGLAMSQDGRTLYCGTEEGIFEFKMNLHIRKSFPAISPR